MATSGGLGTNPGPRRGILTQKLLRIAAVILISLLPASDTAQEAKRQYSMDLRSDCIIAGFLDVPRGQVTYVQGRSMSTSLSNQQLSCYLQFTPQTEGDTLKMWFESGAYIEDCDVSLDIELNKDNRYTLGCRSYLSSIPKMEAINGRAVIKFTRKTFNNVGFSFQIGISAERSRPSSITAEPKTFGQCSQKYVRDAFKFAQNNGDVNSGFCRIVNNYVDCIIHSICQWQDVEKTVRDNVDVELKKRGIDCDIKYGSRGSATTLSVISPMSALAVAVLAYFNICAMR